MTRASILYLVFLLLPPLAVTQEPEVGSREEGPQLEAEAVASDVFRSGAFFVKTWRELHFEGEYFGAPDYDIGITGLSWKFRWKALAVSPGLAEGFGRNAATAPKFTFRWNLDTHRWFSQGFFGRSLKAHAFEPEMEEGSSSPEPVAVHSSILDNNHVSLRIAWMEAGGLWEHIKYREENEWKGGVRVAARIRKVKFIFQCAGPSVEYRAGIAVEK
jgi:hypothetical protein